MIKLMQRLHCNEHMSIGGNRSQYKMIFYGYPQMHVMKKEGQSEAVYRYVGHGLVSIQLIIVFAYMDLQELYPGN